MKVKELMDSLKGDCYRFRVHYPEEWEFGLITGATFFGNDILSGTSAGAIVSVFIADGRQPFEIMEMFSDRSFTELAKIRFGKLPV